jgi:hypothetical protein
VSRRTAARLGWSLFGLSVLLLVPAAVLNLRRPQVSELWYTTGELLGDMVLVVFGWFGALIVSRRPNHSIGWLLCAFGLTGGLGAFATEYAIYGLVSHPGALPGAAVLAWATSCEVAVRLALLAALLLLFPSGRPPSPRWWLVLWLVGIANTLVLIGTLPRWALRGVVLLQTNGPEFSGVLAQLANLGFQAALVAVLAAGVSLLVRFRRAGGDERQQLKWLLFAVVIVVLGVPLLSVAPIPIHPSELAVDIVVSLLVSLIPVAVGLAVLKFRLYDIDRLISRTLAYGLLTVILGLGYAAGSLVFVLVAGTGADPPSWLVAAATLAAAAIFRPARRRIQTAVDRRFNRRKYNSAQTIQAFSTRLRDQIDLDTLSTELLAVVDQTMQPTRASLWLRPSAAGSSSTARSEARPTTWSY